MEHAETLLHIAQIRESAATRDEILDLYGTALAVLMRVGPLARDLYNTGDAAAIHMRAAVRIGHYADDSRFSAVGGALAATCANYKDFIDAGHGNANN